MCKYPANRKFVFLDVETPNTNNDSVCSLSVIVVENGSTIFTDYSLINPKAAFYKSNTNVHGLSYDDVRYSPEINIYWKKLEPYMDHNTVIVAHNAPFDLSVIQKALLKYHVSFMPDNYIDTIYLALKYLYPYLTKQQARGLVGLAPLSEKIGFDLDHHNAASDTDACRHIFEDLCDKYSINIENEIHPINKIYEIVNDQRGGYTRCEKGQLMLF